MFMTIDGLRLGDGEFDGACNSPEGAFASEQRHSKSNDAQPLSKSNGLCTGQVNHGVISLETTKFMGTDLTDLHQRAALAAIYKPAQHSVSWFSG